VITHMNLWRCKTNGDHPHDYLAKSGYKPNMKYTSLINLLYLLLHNTENQNRNLAIFFLSLSDFQQLRKPFKITYFSNFENFTSVSSEISPDKKEVPKETSQGNPWVLVKLWCKWGGRGGGDISIFFSFSSQ
jgi:hypothetical protein